MPRVATPTVREASKRYMLSRSHCAENTLTNDSSVLNRFVNEVGPDRQVGYLTVEQVTRAMLACAGNQAPSSFNKVRQRVRGMLAYCVRNNWAKVDLMVDVQKRPVPQVERRKLDAHDMVRIAKSVPDDRDRAMLVFGANTLLRASEIVILKVGAVNLDRGDLHVYRPKNRHTDTLRITPALDSELRHWLRWYAMLMVKSLDVVYWLIFRVDLASG